MNLVELQVDRLVGPSHHFGGLGVGNLASQYSAGKRSNPAAAALQGLDKMRLVAELTGRQIILAPQTRPSLNFLRGVGFAGNDSDILRRALNEAPELLSAASSCSAMWTANAATATPGVDRVEVQPRLTIANLTASLHRAIEPEDTETELREYFSDVAEIQSPLRGGAQMRDEGAANHIRLGSGQNELGIHLFVYGDGEPEPSTHWPRQTKAACQALARAHSLAAENTFMLKQSAEAIDAGAFHNDVVAMSHQDLFIHHQQAFDDAHEVYQRIETRFKELTGNQLRRIEVSKSELSLKDAVSTYLFNSQIVSNHDSELPSIICPIQVSEHPHARTLVDDWCSSGCFGKAYFVDLGQSMSGGGGPACLRLRVPISDQNAQSLRTAFWSDALDQQLRELIEREYPTRLTLADLARGDFHAHAINTVGQLRQLLVQHRSNYAI